MINDSCIVAFSYPLLSISHFEFIKHLFLQIDFGKSISLPLPPSFLLVLLSILDTNRPRFIDAAKYMFRRLFRVFAHIHYGHWHFLTASKFAFPRFSFCLFLSHSFFFFLAFVSSCLLSSMVIVHTWILWCSVTVVSTSTMFFSSIMSDFAKLII